MPQGPDGDDEELVEIDVEIADADATVRPPPLPAGTGHAGAPEDVPALVDAGETTQPNRTDAPPLPDLLEISDAVELQPPLMEASEDDPAVASTLYEEEASAAEGGRRAALLLEAARLREEAGVASGAGAADALEKARAAFAADPASARARWVMRRMLSRAGRWGELAEISEQAIAAQSAAADPRERADLLIERGRLLDDRLGRAAEAVEAYRAALAAAPDHPGGLLALLVAGARQEEALRAEALGGLARGAQGVRRGALVLEAALAWRGAASADADERALVALEGELARQDPEAPLGMLLGELDALTRADVSPAIAVRALEELARRAAPTDPRLAVALARERARLLRQALEAPEAALEVLDEAARLDPAHPLLAAERIELALALDQREAAGDVARAFVADAARDDEAVDLALAYAEAIFDPAHADPAIEILQAPRIRARHPVRSDLRAAEIAIAVRKGDPHALAEAFVVEADAGTAGDGASKTAALIAAAAIHAGPLGETEAAADLYRAAIAGADTAARSRPAVQALVALQAAGGRVEEAAATLEAALAMPGAGEGPAGEAFEIWTREVLVSFYADQLGAPGAALPHQKCLVELRPLELERRVRLCDLDLASGADRLPLAAQAENLRALAAGAGDVGAAIALDVAAGRALAESATRDEVVRGLALLRELAPEDLTGLAAATLERLAASPVERADTVAAELAIAEADPSAERTRALRFRLAHHRASAGAFAEAIAALTPLRSEGDPLARAWSYELARRAGDAFLEVAVLSEETRAPDGALGDEARVLLAHGEALARAGDPQGAAESLRRAVARAPDGETAADAALGLYRLATGDPVGGAAALPDTLDALRDALGDDPALAAAVGREAALSAAAVGAAVPNDARLDDGTTPHELALLRFMAGARAGDAAVVAAAMVEMARELTGPDGPPPPDVIPLLGRAAARARLGGAGAAETTARAVWAVSRVPALAPALADLPVAGAAPWPADRPDPRRARARRAGGALGVALHLEAAVDAERAGHLGAALQAYGSVIALEPDRLEAWTGVRRVARAGGDRLGEARALARLGVLVRDPAQGAALSAEAGAAYEQAGRLDDAIAVLARAVELDPDDPAAYARAHALLSADLAAPGRAETFDGLLSYRLAAGTLGGRARIALLFERAEHRLSQLGDRAAAFADLKQILKINPEHVASLHKLAEGALADKDTRAATTWLERYLAAAGSDEEQGVAAAKLDLAACYDARGEPVRAIETLRRAAQDRPSDPTPLERMADIQLGRRDARGAVEALGRAAERLADPHARATLALRAGTILRDQARDAAGAAVAFRQAADLDPLGAGATMLVALHDAASDARGALQVVEREVADLRRALAGDPLDARRLERLGDWLADARRRGSPAALPEAEAAVESVRGLVGGRASPLPPPAVVAPKSGRAFLAEIGDPAAGGFVAEVWPHLAEAVAALFPAPARARPAPLGAAEAGRLGWIGAVAAALGIPRLALLAARAADGPIATAVEEPDAAVILRVDALASPALRFHVGRALGAIAARSTVLERATAAELAPLFAAAAVLAGAPVPTGLPTPSEALLRDVGRAVGRRDRKALALQASRFGFEPFDLEAWRTATLRVADRFGLLVAGDPAQAAVALAGGARAVAGNGAALDLLGFAVGESYPALRRAVEGQEPGQGQGSPR
ncbi:MAG TPA: tetratricopeptide repeat protein [Polyangia bacterium]|jgi:tetratricopeptide (TPR) repeat protein